MSSNSYKYKLKETLICNFNKDASILTATNNNDAIKNNESQNVNDSISINDAECDDMEMQDRCFVLKLINVPLTPITAVSTSDNEIRFLDVSSSNQKALRRSTNMLKFSDNIGTLKHHKPITDMEVTSAHNSTLFSCSSDFDGGEFTTWDLRTQTAQLSIPFDTSSGREGRVTSCALSMNGLHAAIACGTSIYVWDLRKSYSPMMTFEDSHSEEVTQVKFHPVQHNLLISGGEDGLICKFNTSLPNCKDDEALESVLMVNHCISTIDFFGPNSEALYCLTTTEQLSIFDINEEKCLKEFGDMRPILANCSSNNQFCYNIEYLIDCHYEANTSNLLLTAADHRGNIVVANVNTKGAQVIGTLSAGHEATVRCANWNFKDGVLLTGGEDARICYWTNNSSLIEDDSQFSTKQRSLKRTKELHSPY